MGSLLPHASKLHPSARSSPGLFEPCCVRFDPFVNQPLGKPLPVIRVEGSPPDQGIDLLLVNPQIPATSLVLIISSDILTPQAALMS
jgi:hypothetical protein